MSGFVVAIDGKAGSGKSTTARGVAKQLNFFYLDTGAMYRAFTLKYLKSGGTKRIDFGLVNKLLTSTRIELYYENALLKVLLDGNDVSKEIRTPEVNELVSPISAIKEVREWMVKQQREIAGGKDIVCEGRDMATVVFPDAPVKIFMDASPEIRAERRKKELEESGVKVPYDEILANLKYRDQYDSSREHSPLKKTEDAIIIDTTHLTIEQEIAQVVRIVKEKLQKM